MRCYAYRDRLTWHIARAFAPLLCAAFVAEAQTNPPASSTPADAAEDLAYGRRLLEDVRDNVFSFDDPAFYWFCRYVKHRAAVEAPDVHVGVAPVPWRFLLERPSDYRGRLVVIEGVLLARPAFEVSGLGREGIGRLYQCELAEVGTRALCAVITVEEPQDIPIRSRVRAKGYFIKVRAYRTTLGDTGAGPLLVARRLEIVHPPVANFVGSTPGRRTGTWIVVGTAALAIIWLVLRRRIRSSPVTPPGRHPPPKTEAPASDEDFDWLLETRHERDSGVSPESPSDEGTC